jgi:hypothetical protein
MMAVMNEIADNADRLARLARPRRAILPAFAWGAAAFLVTFGSFYYLEMNRLTLPIAAMLFPNLPVDDRYVLFVSAYLSIPPLVLGLVAGLWHRSFYVAAGCAFVYAAPLCVFFVLAMTA